MERTFFVYVMASRSRVLYVGVTNDLIRRSTEHREGTAEGFTRRYKCNRLVWYEVFARAENAIATEKRLKGWKRERKLALIEAMNPAWADLAIDLGGLPPDNTPSS